MGDGRGIKTRGMNHELYSIHARYVGMYVSVYSYVKESWIRNDWVFMKLIDFMLFWIC